MVKDGQKVVWQHEIAAFPHQRGEYCFEVSRPPLTPVGRDLSGPPNTTTQHDIARQHGAQDDLLTIQNPNSIGFR